MVETAQHEKGSFEFNARTATSGQTDVLEVDVKNVTDATWDGFLLIELKLPREMGAPNVQQAALDARISLEPSNMATLAGIVTAAEGWSVWAINDPSDHIVVIRFFNCIDQRTAALTETNTPLAAGAVLKLRIPLAPGAVKTKFEIDYGYQMGTDSETRFDGSLELTPTHLSEWTPPLVSLTCPDQENPTMLKPGEEVNIEWHVENGIAATLRGPLPGGNSQQTLSRDTNSNYQMREGKLTTVAVGPATYVLDAEVKGPEGQPNVQIIRTLTLDIYSANKYAYLSLNPQRVLPNGQVTIDWAVWGVKKAFLFLGDRDGLELELTQQNLSRTFQGTGSWLVHAKDDPYNQAEVVSIKVVNNPKHQSWVTENIQTVRWQPVTKPVYTGKPVALAVADGNMALLTRDGLFTAPVGRDARDHKEPVFVKSAATGRAWHALAAFGRGFVLLRQTDGDDIVLERYDGKGQRVGLPITLPADFQTLARRNGAVFDLVGFGERVYVVVEASVGGPWARVAYSVRPDVEEPARSESHLAFLFHYRLITCGGMLYAFQRGSGRMLRFSLTKTGELDNPRRAASAINDKGLSMITTGLLVTVGSVIAVIDPAALPSFDPLMALGLLNVVSFHQFKPPADPNKIPQDLSYNPQKNKWTACGHGLDIQAGAIAAFRGGGSKRLWVLQPDGTMQALAVATEELFAPEYLDQLHLDELAPALDSTRQLRVANLSGLELVPVDEFCKASGFGPVTAEGPAQVTPTLFPVANAYTDFVISYSSTHTEEVKLRFMVAHPGSARYLLEVTLSGAGLGTVTSVFKRLTADGRLNEVPETSKTDSSNPKHFTVMSPRRLHDKTRFLILNATPGELSLAPAVVNGNVGESAAFEVTHATPDFKITLPNNERLGQLSVTIDYTLPMGVEMSPRSRQQRSLIRIATDEAGLLELSSDRLEKISSVVFSFEKYDGSRSGFLVQPSDTYWLRVGVKKRLELDGVRLGDAAVSPNRKAIFLALARPDNVKQVRVVRFDLPGLTSSEKSYETNGTIFSVPNAITVSEMYYDVMFAEPTRHTAMHNFGTPWPQMFDGYTEVVALASSHKRNVFNVGKRVIGQGEGKRTVYFLSVAYLGNSREETPLDNIAFPVGIPPLAVSPDGNTAAVADQGGVILVDMRVAAGARKAQSIRIPNIQSPSHAVFSNDGDWVFCAHVTRVMSGNPRRIVAGRDITITRVRISDLIMRQTIGLPNVEGNFGLTGNTKQSFGVNVTSKEEVALSLAVSPDDKNLFVSAGTSIMKIALNNFTLQPWRATVELPCRLICVNESTRDTYMVYALGSHYVGDGTKVDEYKTHLYFVPAPVR